MSNSLKSNQIFGRHTLLAIPLSISLLAFGCTTDRTLGNGNLNDYSGVRSAPTSGVTTGSQLPPPMTSSYSRPVTTVQAPRTIKKLTPDEAALIMVDHRPKVRVLGPVNPAGVNDSVSIAPNSVTGISTTTGTVTVSQEGTAVVAAPMTARNITPTSTAGRVNPVSTARSVQPVSTAVNLNPTSASAVRIVNDGRSVTVTNQ